MECLDLLAEQRFQLSHLTFHGFGVDDSFSDLCSGLLLLPLFQSLLLPGLDQLCFFFLLSFQSLLSPDRSLSFLFFLLSFSLLLLSSSLNRDLKTFNESIESLSQVDSELSLDFATNFFFLELFHDELSHFENLLFEFLSKSTLSNRLEGQLLTEIEFLFLDCSFDILKEGSDVSLNEGSLEDGLFIIFGLLLLFLLLFLTNLRALGELVGDLLVSSSHSLLDNSVSDLGLQVSSG